jgi:PAS domain S-box-containing protein
MKKSTSGSQTGSSGKQLQPLRVLIVEDSEDDCLLVVQQLRRAGFDPEYRRVFTPEAMLEALEGQSWEVIISDYSMPRFSGPAALELYQQKEIDIPFLVVSGTVGETLAVDTMIRGAHDYLMKDRLDRLGPAIQREMQQARVRAERRQAEKQKQHLAQVLAAIRSVNQLIVREKSRHKLVQQACDTLAQTRGFNGAWIVLTATNREDIVSGRSLIPEETFTRFLSLIQGGELPNCCQDLKEAGVVAVARNHRKDCLNCPLAEIYNRDSALVAQIAYEGRLLGYLGVSLPGNIVPNQEESSLIEEVAGDLGFGLCNQEQEVALRESEERHRRLFETMSQGVVYKDAQGAITMANPAAERILGLSLDQITGRFPTDPSWRAIHEDGSPFPSEEHPSMTALSTGRSVQGVIMGVFHPEEGDHRWIRVNAVPLFAEGSNTPSEVYTIFADITESRKAEIKLRENLDTLQQARERLVQQAGWLQALNSIAAEIARRNNLDSIFQLVLGHLEDSFDVALAAICLFEQENEVCVPAAINNHGRSLARRLGIKIGTPLPLSEILQPAVDTAGNPNTLYPKEIDPSSLGSDAAHFLERVKKQNLQTLTTTDLTYEESRTGLLIIFSRDRRTYSEVECRFLKGMAEYMSVAMQNRKLYDELEQSYLTLQKTQHVMMEQERMKAMGQMASGIAHDINNTLAPITLYTEALLAGELGKTEPASRYLATIQSAVGDIEGITHRLRAFYKHEEAEQAEAVDIGEVIETVVDLTRPRWKNMPNKLGIEITLETEVAPRLAPILGDRTEIREALINLVFNAVDALPKGGTITIRAGKQGTGKEDRRLAVEVSDTGTGMDEEQRRKCLEPFFTTKGAEGSGLGLAVVYGTVQRHQGEMQIDSSPGQGTTVRLLFPLPHQPPRKGAGKSEPTVMLPPLRILCVDDNPSVQEVLQEILRQHGHTVESFEEGKAALDAFKAAQREGKAFQVVITDLGMPHMDGKEVARRIKTISPKVPVILLSGWGNFMNLESDLPPHVDCVLSKPPSMARLLPAIGELIGRRGDGEAKEGG